MVIFRAYLCVSGTCENHIGMGVRYNAEKKKIGNYYSTPIYSFRCKCHLCDGWFEIQTDPKVCILITLVWPFVEANYYTRLEHEICCNFWSKTERRRVGPGGEWRFRCAWYASEYDINALPVSPAP